ncbi:MAG: hypothetical protein Q7S23_04040 [bacterium]|nr:hypothetical protein [bacterium]
MQLAKTNDARWAFIGVYLILLVVSFSRIDRNSHSVSDTLINFVPLAALLTLAFALAMISSRGKQPPA